MAASIKNNNRLSLVMERTGRRVSQEIPPDVVIEVGEVNFNLHKFMLVAKSNYLRKLIIDSKEPDLSRINLSDMPGGPESFEKAAKFCYGVNFEITVHNIAALRCAAEYLQMTDKYSDVNLTSRTEEFLSQVALTSLTAAAIVLKSCEDLLPMAEELKIVQRCVDVASTKNFVNSEKIVSLSHDHQIWIEDSLKVAIIHFSTGLQRGPLSEYITAELVDGGAIHPQHSLLREDHRRHEIARCKSPNHRERDSHLRRDMAPRPSPRSFGNWQDLVRSIRSRREIRPARPLESIVKLLPSDMAALPIGFLCCLLRTAIFLRASNSTKHELERRVSALLEHVTVDDLLVVSFTYDGERLFDLESARRIVAGFVEKERNVAGFNATDFSEGCSAAMVRVAKTVDAYLGEVATCCELSIAKFNGIANLVPKEARKVEDDLYRALDIFLKAHPSLDEIEREKACSVMNPLKLSYEARVHASKNKRLPLQIVLHALYYDQLKIRSNTKKDHNVKEVVTTRRQVQADMSLIRENEALRKELTKMKMMASDVPKKQGSSSNKVITVRRPTLFSTMSKTLGKLNPFKHGSKDTSNIEDIVDIAKPRRRRFSIS
ncbi:phototropic-responsive NPH3 family protein [Actinidia rufa]|uniref:Phototropic-responsive NPH3 family protein n=1 Tax=Actinidia rufa TaxID=165716 RepID=A0A7J0FLA6_9ERIC|nr:phototropic-responsive NPH3 family protein [Actinidia rufa]